MQGESFINYFIRLTNERINGFPLHTQSEAVAVREPSARVVENTGAVHM